MFKYRYIRINARSREEDVYMHLFTFSVRVVLKDDTYSDPRLFLQQELPNSRSVSTLLGLLVNDGAMRQLPRYEGNAWKGGSITAAQLSDIDTVYTGESDICVYYQGVPKQRKLRLCIIFAPLVY